MPFSTGIWPEYSLFSQSVSSGLILLVLNGFYSLREYTDKVYGAIKSIQFKRYVLFHLRKCTLSDCVEYAVYLSQQWPYSTSLAIA